MAPLLEAAHEERHQDGVEATHEEILVCFFVAQTLLIPMPLFLVGA